VNYNPNNDGKMERCRLRACTGMGYAYLNPILEKLARKARSKWMGFSIPSMKGQKLMIKLLRKLILGSKRAKYRQF
jgi:hypothetical protein